MNETASRMHHLELCVGSAVLQCSDDSNPGMRAGTARHRYAELAPSIGSAAALLAVPEEHREECAKIDVDALPAGEREVALAYDVDLDAGRELGSGIERQYDVEDSEIAGTADVVTPPDGDDPTWMVTDYKSDTDDMVEPAASNLQLGTLALPLARIHGLSAVAVQILRVPSMRREPAVLDAAGLVTMRDRVRAVHARVAAARAGEPYTLHPGAHCPRCPALRSCPAMTGLARAGIIEAETTDEQSVRDRLALMTDAEAGTAWARFKLLEKLVGVAQSSLRKRVKRGPLPLPDGSVLETCVVEVRKVDVERALPVLRARFGEQADASVEVKRTIPTEAIEKLAAQIAPPRGKAKTVAAVWAELEAAEAVSRVPHDEVKARKPRGGKRPSDAPAALPAAEE